MTGKIRKDPLSGRLVVIAPERGRRPGARRREAEPPAQAELDECPFCEGREGRTPPETFAVPSEGREPDTPGWQVRVVPNLYPAVERQEVVVHTSRHARSIAELDEKELPPIASAWDARMKAARGAGFDYVQLLVNEGRAAGASLPHTHSQLVWLREPPPAVAAEYPQLAEEQCALCSVLRDDTLEITLNGPLSLHAAYAGRLPYELLVAPTKHEGHPGEGSLGDALVLLRDATRRLRGLEGDVPLNIWLHAGAHWHFELVPRLTTLAGLELGAGIYVNWLPPAEAAERLRSSTA